MFFTVYSLVKPNFRYIVITILICGIIPIIITGRTSGILENRCKEIGITRLYQGVSDKFEKLNQIMENSSYKEVAYIGDDINDLSCMQEIKNGGGLVGCPADAVNEVKNIADLFLIKKAETVL